MKKKKIFSAILISTMLLSMTTSVFADVTENDATLAPPALVKMKSERPGLRIAQSKNKKCGDHGKITSNVWRQTFYSSSGNTYQWDYQVSAQYDGDRDVETIRTTWYATASLRKSGSIDLGISNSGGQASSSSTWQTVETEKKYWENTKGQTIADYASNVVVSPSKDYRLDTISVHNNAWVKCIGDAKPYQVNAAV